jgi:hypothetical protein
MDMHCMFQIMNSLFIHACVEITAPVATWLERGTLLIAKGSGWLRVRPPSHGTIEGGVFVQPLAWFSLLNMPYFPNSKFI